MLQAAADDAPVLIEATCNQVNHQGGYTGLTPAAFRDELHRTADRVGFPHRRILLGGDHLGRNPWRHLPAEAALREAEAMVAAYVAAGYEKVHLDTSMGCQGEPEHLPDALTAERAARLAAVAERVAADAATKPRYVIGTEVPPPGGATADIKHLEVTPPQAVLATLEAHRRAFGDVGAQAAFERVVAVVVQPGVEFDNQKVVAYEAQRVRQAQRRAGRDARPGVRGALHRLPAPGRPRQTGERRICRSEGGTCPHFRVARGALRARPDRIGAGSGVARAHIGR